MNDIIVAIIGLIGTSIVAVLAYLAKSKKDVFMSIDKRLCAIEKRLDEHNHYAEKFSEQNKELAVINERQQMLYKGVEKIQKDIDYLKSDRCQV